MENIAEDSEIESTSPTPNLHMNMSRLVTPYMATPLTPIKPKKSEFIMFE